MEFYDDYFSIVSNKGNLFKDKFIRSKMKNDRIYKFVAFTEDENLNLKKLIMLEKKQFWASCYNYFEDRREVLRIYDKYKVQFYTKKSQKELDCFFDTLNEMNDISCFTYNPSNFMWEKYANKGNGFCMEFDLKNSDKFFPVIYLNKNKIDYTDDIIKSFDFQQDSIIKLAILPWVTKDLNFQRENELRFLCGDIYDSENGPMNGKIAPNKKKMLEYKGIEYSFKYSGINLLKVSIGANCTKKQEILDICHRIGIDTELLK